MSSISLVISEKDNKLKSALSLMLHNSFTVAASDIFYFTEYNKNTPQHINYGLFFLKFYYFYTK